MTLVVWRHPKPQAVAGLCLGHTDARVDRRKAKRLAHRVRRWARSAGAPHVVVTSRLERGAAVGWWLARWGWQHVVDERLAELDFGTWDGCEWAGIGAAPVQAWCDDFMHHAPGGGEPVAALLQRCAALLAEQGGGTTMCAVGHAGWISAALWLRDHPGEPPTAATWPAAVRYGERISLGD